MHKWENVWTRGQVLDSRAVTRDSASVSMSCLQHEGPSSAAVFEPQTCAPVLSCSSPSQGVGELAPSMPV